MAGYAIVTNIDKIQQPYANYLWSFLGGHNRKSIEVSDWTKSIIGIPNSSNFGLLIGDSGDYTVFRKHKTDNTKIAYTNVTINCQVSQNVVFVVSRSSQVFDGFNFRVAINFIELGGNLQSAFEYGIIQEGSLFPIYWQADNTFNIINEGVYSFDVRKIGATTSVGKQSIELYLNQNNTNIGGGDESDNPMPGTFSGE